MSCKIKPELGVKNLLDHLLSHTVGKPIDKLASDIPYWHTVNTLKRFL